MCKKLRVRTKFLIKYLILPWGSTPFCAPLACLYALLASYLESTWQQFPKQTKLYYFPYQFNKWHLIFPKNHISNCSALHSISFSVPIYRCIKLLWTLQFTKYFVFFFLCSEMLFFTSGFTFLSGFQHHSTWHERNVRRWGPCSVSLALPCLCLSMYNPLSNEEVSGTHRCCVVVHAEVYVQTLFRT